MRWRADARRRIAQRRGRPHETPGACLANCGRAARSAEGCPVSSPALETFLAKLYTDEEARVRFLADMRGEAARAGLSEAEVLALAHIDRIGLQMAAASYAHKR